MNEDTIHIGSWQGRVVDGDVHANIATVRRVLHTGLEKNLHFICFPESFLSGYSKEAIETCGIAADDSLLRELINESRNNDMVTILGFTELFEGQRYNSAMVYQHGEMLGMQRKTILTGYDKELFAPDTTMLSFDAHGIRFGIAICHTTSFPEPAMYFRWKGVRLLFTPHFNSIPAQPKQNDSEFNFWTHRNLVLNNHAALAALMRMVVVRSNVIVLGDNAKLTGIGSGDSNIWDMDGNVRAFGTPFVESLVTADFDRHVFTEPHWIDRNQVPAELMDMIHSAAMEDLD